MDGAGARLAQLACDIARSATDGDMLVVIDRVAGRSAALSLKSQPLRPSLALLLRDVARDGASRHSRRLRVRAMLTARERDVAALLECGLSNGAIAAQLEISPRTIRAHLEAINQKLFTRNRTELLSRLLGF